MGKFGYRCSDQGLKTLDDSKLVDYIQELECDNNPDLDAISTAIGKCKNLETLMANNCSISAIPVELCAASSSLTSVNLSFNQITEVPPGLAALTALVDIDLSSNLLATVPDAVLAGWASIEFLYLSDNKLTTVGSVAPCHKLYELRLNVCRPSDRLPGCGARLHAACPLRHSQRVRS